MPTFIATADANGDFTVPFLASYTAGQKITVTAEKDSAIKTIELYAPSDTTGGVLSFGGSLLDFPLNITSVTIKQISGSISNESFSALGSPNTFMGKATSLVIDCDINNIGFYSFSGWPLVKTVQLPPTLLNIGEGAFYSCGGLESLVFPNGLQTIEQDAFNNCTSILNITFGTGLTSIGANAFAYLAKAVSVTCLATTPPTIQASTFTGIKSTVKYYVPAASLAAYKAAPIWKTFASKIYAIP